ncbi:MAG: amino acid racemase, partial [Acidobacteriota bacterium]
YFFSLIIKHTRASKDQEHIPILIYSNPKVPERTSALLGKGPSPVPLLREGARRLARAGADFIAVPCITAHAFFPEITSAVKIPLLDVTKETAAYARRTWPHLRRVGLMSSTGTLRAGLFPKALRRLGIEVITLTEAEQAKVMEAVFGPKGVKAGFTAGRPRRLVLETARRLIRRGAEAIIAGCTEIPLVIQEADIPVPLIEPLQIAALACIIRAGYKTK